MSLQLKLLQLYTPGFLKQQALGELYGATADAFGCPMPSLEKLPFGERLKSYASFTAAQAERAIESGQSLGPLQARLRQNAYRLGQRLRERFGLRQPQEIMALARVLYGIIGIDFVGSPEGEIVIRHCYFGQFYSPRVCQLISALDEGLLAGLAGGGKLIFSERITAGATACKACFLQEACPAWKGG